ncbi:hect E3 ubiquitin ligase [Anopheles darlingi]|uniref:sphingosine kinase n=2 Tax=Anopheles darlingi TaxID=43151 RepID=W5JA25_ANODA|nr:probable E3 ubiquitin-protein ligase HERC4 isoform X3 [Anopheles darlingi]ETN59614.1 hect E3 ubiquitin ligase [Anopheles darlingi]
MMDVGGYKPKLEHPASGDSADELNGGGVKVDPYDGRNGGDDGEYQHHQQPQPTVYLTETFYISSKKNTVFEVRLTDKGLCLKKQSNGSTKEQTIPLKDIIGCRCLRSKRRSRGSSSCTCASISNSNALKVVEENSGEQDETDVSAYLYIYAYILKRNRRGGFRERTTITLRFRSFDRYEDNNREAQKWRAAVKYLIAGEPVQKLTYQPRDPRKMLIILNPKSGSGKAREMFQQRVAPIFAESEILYDLHITKRSNWAREFVRQRDVYLWRGIVVVGGDGIFFEVLNGLFEREDWQTAIEELPIGIVPCGSGNGLAKTVSFLYEEPFETKPVLAAALMVVKGRHSMLDVVRVETRSNIMFSFLSVGWGLISDIDIESERLRAIGGQRFTVWSVHRLISLRTYHGKVSYLPALPSQVNGLAGAGGVGGHYSNGGTGTGSGRSGAIGTLKHSVSYNTTLNCRDCRHDTTGSCDACDTNFSDVLSLETGMNLDSFRPRIDSWYSATSRKSTYFSTVDSVYESDKASNDDDSGSRAAGGANGTGGPIVQMYGPPSRLPALTAALPDTWTTITGEFVMVHAAYQTHLSTDCYFATQSQLNDGLIWLLIIRGGVSRSQLLSFLLGLSSGTHLPVQANEYIQMVPVTAFRIEPVGTNGHMTVDGENVECGPIQGEVFPNSEMAFYCWGNTAHGELGLGGIEEEQVMVPRKMDWMHAKEIARAACGASHTLLLTNDGKMYSCGNNDHGQLGHDVESLPNKRPRMSRFKLLTALENYIITQACCGTAHSLALTNWGQVYSWGSNAVGQLGQETDTTRQIIPRLIRSIAAKQVVQIAAGHYHCLALTNSGELYAWGSNAYGQLGLGMTNEKVSTPTLVQSLAGVPIAFIACGGNHSFAVSKSGAIFGWGKNTFGQLGLNDLNSRQFPTQLRTLRSLGVRYVSCGDDFSVFLTAGGGVFTCGAGTFGQLGHGSCNNEILPRMVFELMGSKITQIACGRRHTLAFVPSRGKIYGFGLSGVGQLGIGIVGNYNTPQIVRGPWLKTDSQPNDPDRSALCNVPQGIVNRIFSGGDQCFVSMFADEDSDDYRLYDKQSQILTFSVQMSEELAAIKPDDTVELDLMSAVETIFKSLACINGSLLLPNDEHFCCTSKHPGVDMVAATEAFEQVRKIEHESLRQLIRDSITTDLLGSLLPSPADVETLRAYLLLPLYHEFCNPKHYQLLHAPFSISVRRLQKIPYEIVARWWSLQSRDYFERLVECCKSVVLYIVRFKMPKAVTDREEWHVLRPDEHLMAMLDLMAILYWINHTKREQKLAYEQFHIGEIAELVDLQQDYYRWTLDSTGQSFALCNYAFIFNGAAKMLLLQTDQVLQMHKAIHTPTANSILPSLFFPSIPVAQQFIVLNVTRENIVEDTIRELSQYGANDLKKPIKIKFFGEEGEDAGGVRKEFFMLLLRDILDPKYGMFKSFDESRTIWFTEDYFEGDAGMFALIGILCGLAIYNFTIIALPFPLALYKKLLGEEVDMSDLRELMPTVARSMQSLLDYNEPDMADVFQLTFSTTRDYFGELQTIPLKPGGEDLRVTQDNKQEFVQLYIDYVFNKSVEKSYRQFHDGFMRVCGGRVMQLFKAHELMEVVVGNEEYDWVALEENAEYKNGYSSSDQPIRWFWEVFHELPLEEKKKFLIFLTGSDRIPILGMKAIKILIQPTPDDKFLPVAHTCFNLLDLPQYKTKEKLKYKLLQAIQQNQGFNLV